MKKSLLLLLATAMLVVCLAAPMVMAEESNGGRGSKHSIPYGANTVELELIEDYGEEPELDPGTRIYGAIEWEDGALHLINDAGSFFDIYHITSSMLASKPSLKGAKYIVIALDNQSDGDVSFCFQPTNDEYDRLFLSPNIGDPIWLVDQSGVREETDFDAAPDPGQLEWTASGRYAFNIPEGFNGYVFIPVSLFCPLGMWYDSLYTDDLELTETGFHVQHKECTNLLVLINDIYTTGDLPDYDKAASDTPTAAPTEAPTEEPTATPDAEDPGDATEAPKATEAADKDTDSDKDGKDGNGLSTGAVIGIVAAVVVVVVVVVVIVLAKRKKK